MAALGAASLPLHASAAPAKWRIEGTRGAEIKVPGGWKTNDFGCLMSDAPSVVRSSGPELACYTPESPRKELAILDYEESQPEGVRLTGTPAEVTVSGRKGSRLEERLPDGRYAGYVKVPSAALVLTVRTLSRSRTTRILDTLRFVRTDANGCPSDSRRAPQRPGGVKGSTLAPVSPVSVSVCHYGGGMFDDDRKAVKKHGLPIDASYRLSGAEARRLASALNKARRGGNKDVPASQCSGGAAPYPDVVLRFKDRSGRRSTLFVTFQSCKKRGIDNGARKGRITEKLLDKIMDPLHVGYGYSRL
ncbi:hypothetical protein [Actinocorallia populi]|uniref:hypothetical protein n=1 Tax=Actinocorallia populi TaxID=2079200 RepID=UPI000D08A7D7|nr:hypothetical protein [Actinocorallia populi]